MCTGCGDFFEEKEDKLHDECGVVGIFLNKGKAAHLDGDVGLDAGLFLVDGHKQLQSVVQGVDPGLLRISRDRLITAAARQGD